MIKAKKALLSVSSLSLVTAITIGGLLELADERMYFGKNAGKNRTVI